VIAISVVGGRQKAFIKDLLEDESKLLQVGDSIGDAKVLEISKAAGVVRLKPETGEELTLRAG